MEKFKKYSQLSENEIVQIKKLIIKGGEVNPITISERLAQTELIGFIKINNLIVATASIKKPHDNYKFDVFSKANYISFIDDYDFELGYVMVDENFRKERLASKLCKKLCELYTSYNLFATTRVENAGMISILTKNSFLEVGKTYLNNAKTSHLKLLTKSEKK